MQRSLVAVQIILMMVWAMPAQAQTRQSISLEIYPGHGTTLNFRPTGEAIHKVWLDDPSQVTLDFDDANCLGGGEAPTPCTAKVLHLRRIQRLNFLHLPATPATTLTVVTDRNLYTFRLTYPNTGKPHSSILDIQPVLSTPAKAALPSDGQSGIQKIEQGLQVARSRHLIQPGDALWNRLQSLLNLIRTGTPVAQAAQQVGVSQTLLIRLVELSTQSSPL
jgi:hypothetical protein